jgi:hypothetical protein
VLERVTVRARDLEASARVYATVLDPDGNSVEAVHHAQVRGPGIVDHLWIRVADVAAARAFYAGLAPHAGLRHGSDPRTAPSSSARAARSRSSPGRR